MAEDRKRYRDTLKSRYRMAKKVSMGGTIAGGPVGKIIVFLIAFFTPMVFTLIITTIGVVILAGGMVAVYDTDPTLKASVPKSADTKGNDTGSTGRDLSVPKDVQGKFLLPAGTVLTSNQGPRNLKGLTYHDGLDLSGKFGNEAANYIYPVYPGEVVYSNPQSGLFGQAVVVKHKVGGTVLFSLYAHMSKLLVKKGDKIGFKDRIGIMGATGNVTGVHLHLEIHDKNFKYYNRSTSLKVADYLTCTDKISPLSNSPQSVSECMAYRKKKTGSGG